MPHLIVLRDGEPAWEIPLREGANHLGRAPDCDVVLDEEGVSRRHAVLWWEAGGCVLEDGGSRNGTWVNGSRVERAELREGDRVRLGPNLELEFVSAEDAGAAEEEEARPEPVARRRLGGWLFETRWVLQPVDAADGAPVVVSRRVSTVGRDAGAAVRIEDDSISRLHARLDLEGDRLMLTDLKSRNGTRLNGEPVLRAQVETGDQIAFGERSFVAERRRSLAGRRVGMALGGLALLGGMAAGVTALGGWLSERAAVSDTEKRIRAQALFSLQRGIQAYRRGDLDYARGYLLYAGDVLHLAGLTPQGASVTRPDLLFRPLLNDLTPEERSFDFARALDPAAVAAARARLEGLSNREYVERQVRKIAIELGQDEDVPPGFVDQVWDFTEAVSRNAGWFQRIVDRSPPIHPRIREILAEAHLPEVFCYVAWIESSLDPRVTSPAGARGLWQFMPSTAQQFGLTVDLGRGIDERTDVAKSTRAATQYIGNLIRTFGREQFMCALASYNRGEGAVRRAMERIPDPMMASSKKYWYLVDRGMLPRETSEYVPKIVAARIMAEDPERFGLRRP